MATDPRVETLNLLRSIDASLKALVAQSRTTAPKTIADDRDLDSQYGDPVVKFMPRDWTGDSYKGRKFSECPANLLDMIAETFDYFAEQAERTNETTTSGKPVAPYKRKDAARARGWAKRVREGKVPAGVGAGSGEGWPDDEFPPTGSDWS
jgi:hypothetical protein